MKSITALLFLSITFSLIFITSQAQADYQLMIDEGVHKVSDVQQSAEAFFMDKPKGSGSGYKQYKRWEYMALRMMDESGYLKAPEFYINELQQLNARLNENENRSLFLNDNWEEMGPVNWNATTSWNPGVGRITAFSIDDVNEEHIIIGAQTGGVWKSIDGGQNWSPLTDYFSNLSVYSTAIMPENPDVYLFGSNMGRIYKSIDGGATWEQIGSAGNSVVNKIVIHPVNSDIMFASSQNSGVYKSIDGGQSWNSVIADNRGYDIEFKQDNPTIVFASGSFFHKSVDGGDTFSMISGFDNTGAKMIGVSEDDPEVVYVIEAIESRFNGMYVSNDAGENFLKLDHGNNNFFGYSLEADDTFGQAPRDMDIAVNPNNINEVHIAGIHTWMSTDGGQSFSITSHWVPGTASANNIGYNHADVDIIQFYGNTLYTGTDGGIFKATNTTNINSNYYTDITEGLGIRQFYKIGISQTTPVVISGGSQDNGTSFYTADQGWRDWLGADGMESFIDKNNTNIMYGTTQFGQLYRTANGGITYSGINEPGPGQGNWVTPFEQDPTAPNTIYLGYDRIYKSQNSGSSWTAISQFLGGSADHLKIAPSNPNVMYAARGGQLYKTMSGSGTWQQLSGFGGNINSIAIHPTNPDKVAIATTSVLQVFISEDGGQTWESFNSGLPNFQSLALVWQDNQLDGLYLGMNYGIYYIDNTFDEWQVFNNNLPNVIVNELEINYSENKIYAATYGRGLWISPVYEGVLSTNEIEVFKSLNVYPVPAKNYLNVEWNENYLSELRVFDSSGKLVYFENDVNLTNNHQINVSEFSAGIYFLRVNNENGIFTKKISIK